MFKAAYIEHHEKLSFVTLRDISSSGVCFSGGNDVKVGDTVRYCIDDVQQGIGRVTWVEGGRFGVAALEGQSHAPQQPFYIRPRSVRLPLSCEVQLHAGSQNIPSILHNLSLRGTCVTNPGGLYQGQLISLEIAGECFELATVRWVKNDRVGICFARPLSAPALNALLDTLQARARSATACADANVAAKAIAER